ncbi:hypothetical protein [Zhongshania sp.]|uniref:hypothetical protein n=1 Tax=Zhongshania sp. TaxID=1971902 RepID=UPI0035688F2C
MTAISNAVEKGIVYTSGVRESIGSGGRCSLHLDNPSGSGIDLYILHFAVYTEEFDRVKISYFKNATSTGASQTPFNHDFGSGNTPIGVTKGGSGGVLVGGTELSARAGATSRSPMKSPNGLVFVLRPGTSAALEVLRPTALTGSEEVDINVTWAEVPQ